MPGIICMAIIIVASTANIQADTNHELSLNMQADTVEFSNVESHTEDSYINEPPRNEVTEKLPLSSWEFYLSLVVLGFGLLVIAFITFIVFKLKVQIDPSIAIQFIIVTLIITSTLFLITAGYGKDQIAPAIGLLGTIAGYLLGRSQKEFKETGDK